MPGQGRCTFCTYYLCNDRRPLQGGPSGRRDVNKSGSVWESNPLTAFFKPPAGFEDQGPHQRCKHSPGRRTDFARFAAVTAHSR